MSCQFLAQLASAPKQADLSSDALHLSLQFALGPQCSDGAKLLIFSSLCFFSCCEDRRDDLQVLFMPKMKLEVSLCVFRGTTCNHTGPAGASLRPPGGKREMLITGPRFLADEMPSSLFPSWPGGGMGTGCHEHSSKRYGSQADHSTAAVNKPSSGHDPIPQCQP